MMNKTTVKMIEEFDAFGEEDWVEIFTDDIRKLIENAKSVKNNGKVTRTFLDSFDKTYFMMTDKMGHTSWYRMNEMDFRKQMGYIIITGKKNNPLTTEVKKCKTKEQKKQE